MGVPEYSIVVPAFNAERTIGAALRSVLLQTVGDFELIVVDDGSTDATAGEVARHADSRIRLISQRNRGVSRARNVGIEAARARFVAFLDADDLYMPSYLERMGAALEARADAGYAFCDAWVFDDATGLVQRRTTFDKYHPGGDLPHDPASFLLSHLRANFVHVATMVRREVFMRVGGFDEHLSAVADYEMWLRIVARGYGAADAGGPLALYRTSPRQMSKDRVLMAQDFLRLWALLDELELPPAGRELVAERQRRAENALRIAHDRASRTSRGRRARSRVASVWRRLPGQGAVLRKPPPEVIAAFPDFADAARSVRLSAPR